MQVKLIDATWSNGATTSAAVTLFPGWDIVGFVLPATFTGTSLTFDASIDSGANYNKRMAKEAGGDYSVTVVQGKWVSIDPKNLAGVTDMKINSSVAEGGARTVKVVLANRL